MFVKMKLYAIGLLTVLSGIFFGLLKWRSGQLEDAREKLKYRDSEVKAQKAEHDTTADIQKDFIKKEHEIEKQYGEALKQVIKHNNDEPLSPSMRELLKSSGAARDNSAPVISDN
jgi:hypothetical protein